MCNKLPTTQQTLLGRYRCHATSCWVCVRSSLEQCQFLHRQRVVVQSRSVVLAIMLHALRMAGALFGESIRKVAPTATFYAPMMGVGFVYLAFVPMLAIASEPMVCLLPLLIVFNGFFGGVRYTIYRSNGHMKLVDSCSALLCLFCSCCRCECQEPQCADWPAGHYCGSYRGLVWCLCS